MIALLMLLGYAQPKVQDPETVLHKFDRIAFKDTNLSLRGLNTLELTRKLTASSDQTVQLQGYGFLNIDSRKSEGGLKVAYKFGK